MPDKRSTPATPNDIEEAICRIRLLKDIKMERYQAMLDGALLAVEQVQDKRIEILEGAAVPEVSVGQLCLDLAVAFVLESNFLTGFLSKMMQSTMSGILSAYALKQEQLRCLSDSSDLDTIIRQMMRTWKTQRRSASLRSPVENLIRYRRFCQLLEARGTEVAENSIAVMKAIKEQQGKVIAAQKPLDSTDSPGVSVLKCVQSECSSIRLGISLEHMEFERFVNTGGLTQEDIRTLMEIIEVEPFPKYADELRERYALYFEAVIWEMTFQFQKVPDNERIALDALGSPSFPALKKKSDLLVDYWGRRFARTIEEWSLKFISQPGLGITPLHEGSFLSQPKLTRMSYLSHFLVDMYQMFVDCSRQNAVSFSPHHRS